MLLLVPTDSLMYGEMTSPGNQKTDSNGNISPDPEGTENILEKYRAGVKGTVAPNLFDLPSDPSTGLSSGEGVNDELDPNTPYQETWSFIDYLKGLFESQGNTIAENREFNSLEAVKQREWASAENKATRDWYTEMSNSAYQRSVADMKAAGINPILAYSNGGAAVSSATTSPGSAASSQGVGGDTFSTILNSLANVASAVADFLPNINKIFSQSVSENTNYNYNYSSNFKK